MNAPVTALIAEDEAPQRAALLDLLAEQWPELEVVGACEDGPSALLIAAERRPQVAFLDIRMPGIGGLDVARAVVAGGGLVVFTTAYDEYAVRAFDAGAADYLLKPIQPARLRRTVERLRARLARPDDIVPAAALDALEARLRPHGDRLIRWISASAGDSVRMIGIDEVVYFQAQDKYVRVVTGDDEAVIRTPLKELLAQLDEQRFWQVHRSVIVNHLHVAAAVRVDEGSMHLTLRGRPETLPVSRHFQPLFKGQ